MTELKEKKFKAIPYYVKAYCDKCNKELIMSSNVLPTNPYTYKYECPECEEIYYSHKVYPTIEYMLGKEITEDEDIEELS